MTNEEQTRRLIKISEDIAKMSERLEILYKAVQGNGKPGLVDVTATLEHRLLELESQRKYRTNLWAIIATALSLGIAFYAVIK